MPLEHRYLALHEDIEHRYGEGSFAMTLAPNHALVDELLARGRHRRGLDAERGDDIAGLVGTEAELI